MAVAVKGTANNSNTTSVTIPTHAVGDCIMLVAYKTSVTAPTKPSAAGTVPAWVTIDTQSGNTNSLIACYFVATANNHTSGTWTGAISMTAIVLTGVSPAVIGGHAGGTNASNLTVTGHAITLTNADGSSLIVDFWGRTATVTAWTALSGYTDQTSTTTATGPVVLSTQNAGTSGAVASHVSTGTATVGANEAVEFVSGPHVADATATAESLGTIPPGPILYEPINTADTVTVQIAGGLSPLTVNVADSTTTASTANTELLISNVNVQDATTTGEIVALNLPGFSYAVTVTDSTTTGQIVNVNPPSQTDSVSVADSTTTSEFIVIAFDPPIIFTLEVTVADSTATGEIIGRELDSNLSVSDSTATNSTGNTEQIVSFVNVTDSTTTTSTGNSELLVSNVNVTDATATGEVAAAQMSDMQVTVADATSTGEIVTVSEQGVSAFLVNVQDSTATTSTGNSELLSVSVNVQDATATGEILGFQELSFVSPTDSTATGENVTVSLQAAGGISINVADAAQTGELVNCTTSSPQVAVTDSTSTHEAVGVQFPITGLFNAPRMCDPTLATLILYSSQEVVKAYATAATLLAYSSTGKIQSYSSGCAVKPYSSGSAVSTYTSRATPVAYQSFATIIPYTSTATPKQCSP